MASMTVISGVDPFDRSSSKIRKFYKYTGPSTYVAGGDSVAADDVGMTSIEQIIPVGAAFSGSATRILAWDYTNQKIAWYVPNTGSEASGDLSAYSCNVEVIGH